MAITDKKTGPWGLDQVYNKINQGSIWQYVGENKLFTWGSNEQGQLGQNNTTDYSSPTQVGSDTNWGIISRGAARGSWHMLASKSDGTLWMWGQDYYGSLGQNSHVDYSSPVQIPGTTWPTSGVGKLTCKRSIGSIKTDGTLWMWGFNTDGQLAQNDVVHRSSPVQVPGTTWKDIGGAGDDSVIAIKTDGTLWSWGNNDHGTLGQNNANPATVSSPVQVGSDTTWSAVSKGGNIFALAVKTNGTLWSWGDNEEGNSTGVLGQNNRTTYSSPVQVGGTDWATGADKIAASDRTAIVIKADGTIYSWGGGASGQLGHGSETQRSSPTQIGSASTWDTIAAGETHFIATKTDGTVWTWGAGGDGRLGRSSPGDNPAIVPVELPGTDWGTAQVAGSKRSGMAIKAK